MSKRPLFLAALFFLLGILYRGEQNQMIFSVTIVCLIGSTILQKKKRGWKYAAFCLAAFVLIWMAGNGRMESEQRFRNTYEPELKDGEGAAVQGTIYKKEVEKNRYYLKHCHIRKEAGSAVIACNQILVYLDADALSIGNTILVNGTVKTLETDRNEGNFDEKKFYQSQKIDFKFYGETVRIADANCDRLREYLYQKKENAKKIYQKTMGKEYAGVLSSMVLADRELLDEESRELYQKAGISHILAVSGLHVSIIGMGIYELLKKCRASLFLRSMLSAGMMALFALMVSPGVSMKRALCMFFLPLLGNLIGRSYDSLTALAFAAILLLWENPFLYAYNGFLLSFLAVTGACMGNLVVKQREIEAGWKKQVLFAACLQAMIAPVTAWCYFELPVYVIPINLLLLPAAGALLFLGLAGFAMACICPPLAFLPLKAAKLILEIYGIVCRMFLKLPHSVWITGKPEMRKMIFYYLALGCVVLGISCRPGKPQRERKLSFPLALGFLLFTLLSALRPGKAHFQIKVLDVGQGDGIYLESDRGSRFFVDGGSVDIAEVGKYRILPFLKAQGAGRVDYWFVSHCDADHISGLKEILETDYRVRYLVFSEYVVEDKAFADLKELAEEKGCGILRLKEGERITDDSLSLLAWNPRKEHVTGDRNKDSLVLLLEAGNFRGLLTGDIGTGEEAQLEDCGRIDWYKAAHHGSKGSNSKELLDRLSPRIATVSCGIDNAYGHPGAEAVQNMRDAGAKIYETTECGQITIVPKKEEVQIETYLEIQDRNHRAKL